MAEGYKPIDIKALVAELAARIEPLCAELLPDGRREGHEWSALNPRRGDRHAGSFKVCLAGAKAGIWSDFAAGIGGDALDLVAYLGFEGDKKAAVKWAVRWLGLDGADAPARLARSRQAADANKRQAADDEAKNRKGAFALWLSGQEKLKGTPVERYLAGSRGIDLARLGRQPRALRYHPGLWERETDRKWPAMVAKIDGPDGTCISVHRTWLEVRADGSVTQLSKCQSPKKVWPGYRGGAIRLWRGLTPAGKRAPALAQAPEGAEVLICEGIEDGLTLAMADPSRRILAAVALPNMGNVWLPPTIARVVLVADNDAGRQARADLDRAIAAHLKAGRRVFLARPPQGVKDVNELLQREAG